jgi:hypothetical protein
MNEANPIVKPDYHLIKIDETEHWNKAFLASIGPDARIISVYVFDHNSVSYLCESTPNYALHLASTGFVTSRNLSSTEAEELQEKIDATQIDNESIQYHYCGSIDEGTIDGVKTPAKSKPIRKFVGCDNDVTIDDVREYYLANPW